MMKDNSRGSKRRRDRKYKRRLKRLSAIGFMTGVILVDEEYRHRTVHKKFYKKEYKSGNHPKTGCLHSCKKFSNRKVRRYKGELPNGNGYKKLFDLWWKMY